MATVLPAVLHHRQAHHAAVHEVRAGRSVDRDRAGGRGCGGDVRVLRRRLRRATLASGTSPMRPGWPRAWAPTPRTWRATSSPSRCSTPASSGRRPSGLATAYASADVLGVKHSLHRPVRQAKGFYACYAGLMAVAAALVLVPGVPLGLLTEGVQTLAGVLLPSATVFLLLLCNDKDVLGPWVNSRKLNVFTSAVVWVLVLLSIILTASVPVPGDLEHPDHRRPGRRTSFSAQWSGWSPWCAIAAYQGSRAHGAGRMAGPPDLAHAIAAAPLAPGPLDPAQGGALHLAGLPRGRLLVGDREGGRSGPEIGRGRWVWTSKTDDAERDAGEGAPARRRSAPRTLELRR